jgi:BNR repeat-containing family member
MPTTELPITPFGGFNAYYQNALNTSNPTGSMLFTEQDGSQWGCFAANPGISLTIFHIVGMAVTFTNPGLPVFSSNDQHNACTIALDANNFVWLCYDQHVTPLNCYKSATPRNVSVMSKVSPLVNSTNEAQVTFPLLFTNPVTHALYLIYLQGGGFQSEDAYFYCYNVDTTTWSGCLGTGVNGKMFNPTPTVSTWISGLPQWDKTTGYLWFNWQWQSGTTPFWNCGDNTRWPCAEYLVGWTGNGFIDIQGNVVSLPMTQTSPSPVYIVRTGTAPSFSILDSFSIDTNGTAFMPYIDVDNNGFLQVYVVSSNLHTAATKTAVQLTNNTSVFTPPPSAGWLGTTHGCANTPYSCGENVQSVTAVSSGTCTWITYPDIFNWGAGQAAYKSCDNFKTSTFMYLTTRFNPNIIIFPDQVRNYTTGTIAFLFQTSNDVQFRFSTFINTQPAMYEIIWSPGGSSLSGNAGLSGSASLN